MFTSTQMPISKYKIVNYLNIFQNEKANIIYMIYKKLHIHDVEQSL